MGYKHLSRNPVAGKFPATQEEANRLFQQQGDLAYLDSLEAGPEVEHLFSCRTCKVRKQVVVGIPACAALIGKHVFHETEIKYQGAVAKPEAPPPIQDVAAVKAIIRRLLATQPSKLQGPGAATLVYRTEPRIDRTVCFERLVWAWIAQVRAEVA